MSAAQSVVALALGLFTLLGLLAGLVRHLTKYYLSELRPDGNGGHNLRGRIDKIEQRVDDIYRLLLQNK